jgi:hypothetical protein
MTSNYDIPHEEFRQIRQAIEALYNVPEVGGVYDQQHADTHLKAAVELEEALKELAKLL